MLALGFRGPPRRLLCVGAHADDIEIGCGGTLLTFARSMPDLEVTWVVFVAPGARASEARTSAYRFLEGTAAVDVTVLDFRDGYLPADRGDVKDAFEELKSSSPDVVLTHTRHDAHQDHRLLCELTWNTFRDRLILEYEVPKWDGDLGRPNLYVPLDGEIVQRKLVLLREGFPTQVEKHWYDDETFKGLMRLRGVECASEHAEAFYAPKLLLSVTE